MTRPIWSLTDADLEALISGDDDDLAEAASEELANREDYRAEQYDSPSLQDSGLSLGSYGL